MKSLDDITFRSALLFIDMQISVEVVFLLLNYLNYIYSEQVGEPIQFGVLYIFDKVGVVIFGLLLRLLLIKVKKLSVCYILILAIAIGFFEIYSISRPKYIAYFMFVFTFSLTKNIGIFSKLSKNYIIIVHLLTYVYHFVRIIFQKYQSREFPMFIALMLIVYFIILDAPYLITLQSFSALSKSHECLLRDLNTILNIIPFGLMIYGKKKVLLSNNIFNSFFLEDEIHQIIESNNLLNIRDEKSIEIKDQTFCIKAIPLSTETFGIDSHLISIINNTDVIKKEKIAASENAKWLFVNSTNHQIRTPLSVIESSISMIEKCIAEIGDQNRRCDKYLNLAKISVYNLRHVVDDSVYLFEDMNSNIAVHLNSFDINDLLSEMKNMFSYEMTGKSLLFEINSVKCFSNIISDKKKIFHVVFTLLFNAFKYTSTGKVSLHYFIEPRSTYKLLNITVSDTGIGIKEKDQPEIFNTFFSSEFKRKNLETSTGISLYVAKKLCRLLKGDISFSSVEGKGSIFNVSLRVETEKDTSINEIVINAKTLNKLGDRIEHQVLVVDDNIANIFILASMLHRMAITCDEAHNGEEAIEKYQKYKHKLILMDINMPIMNGYEASAEIKSVANKQNKQVYIVAVSAQNEPLKKEFMGSGINEWVEKPLKHDKLAVLVNKHC